MHRVPHRERRDREDGHRRQVQGRPDRVHGQGREAHGLGVHQLPQHVRGRGAAEHRPPLRPRLPGQGLLRGRDGPGDGVPPVFQPQGAPGDPGRGGRAAQEGDGGRGLPADEDRRPQDLPGVDHPDLPVRDRRAPGRGVHVHVQEGKHHQVQQVLPVGAEGDSGSQGGGGSPPRQDNRGRPGPDRRARRRLRRRQAGDRAPGQGRQHRRGGLPGGGHRGARQGGQGDDLQLRVGVEADVPQHQQDGRRAGDRKGDQGQPGGAGRPCGEDLRGGVRGVRPEGEEAHPVLVLPPGPGQDGHSEAVAGHGPQRQVSERGAAGHTLEGPGGEDGVHNRGDAGGGRG